MEEAPFLLPSRSGGAPSQLLPSAAAAARKKSLPLSLSFFLLEGVSPPSPPYL